MVGVLGSTDTVVELMAAVARVAHTSVVPAPGQDTATFGPELESAAC
jgi:hypothetical protein